MKTFNIKLAVLAGLLVISACNNQPNSVQNTEAVKTAAAQHFECHHSEYRFNTLPPLPKPLPYVDFEPIYIQQQRESPFGNAAKRLTIPMNEALIIPKLQGLGFIEYSNNEIYEKNFRKKICTGIGKPMKFI